MNLPRLAEILRPMLSARAGSPWMTAPATARWPKRRERLMQERLEQCVAAARLGGASPHAAADRRR